MYSSFLDVLYCGLFISCESLDEFVSDLAWAIALQLKDVHGVVYSASIMVELDIPGETLDSYLYTHKHRF